MTRLFVPVDRLGREPYSSVLGYPRATQEELEVRIITLKQLDIDTVIFDGPASIGKLQILGKGHAGVVVRATGRGEKFALKLRRTDSQRKTMLDEMRMLKTANSLDVGPVFFAANKDMLVMEYAEGQLIGDWVKTLKEDGDILRLAILVEGILEDCYRMDQYGLDHGELSNISKHVIVRDIGHVIIDFESASLERRVSNVTSATQALFVGSAVSREIERACSLPAKEEIIDRLRAYKSNMSRQNFNALMETLKIDRRRTGP